MPLARWGDKAEAMHTLGADHVIPLAEIVAAQEAFLTKRHLGKLFWQDRLEQWHYHRATFS